MVFKEPSIYMYLDSDRLPESTTLLPDELPPLPPDPPTEREKKDKKKKKKKEKSKKRDRADKGEKGMARNFTCFVYIVYR